MMAAELKSGSCIAEALMYTRAFDHVRPVMPFEFWESLRFQNPPILLDGAVAGLHGKSKAHLGVENDFRAAEELAV